MRAKGFLIGGVAAFVIGIVGIIVTGIAASGTGPAVGWGFGYGGMMGTPGMAGMMGGPVTPTATSIGIQQAETAAQNYVSRFRNANLKLDEIMEFSANYYVQVIEQDTNVHAFELLVDKYTGAVYPEMGPNMLWNTKYSLMSGMMGRWAGGQRQSGTMSVGPDQAQALARQYLKTQGLTLDVDQPDQFYGYYTLHTLQGGGVSGMLSVNGYNGAIWYHVWHGPFIQMVNLQTSQGAGQ